MYAVLRILIGLVLLASGIEKTISPYQNFLFVIQAYNMLPSGLETAVAMILPWIELIVGIMLVTGYCVPLMLRLALLMFAMFIIVVAQALLRGLPIDQCGCFGQSIHIPPKVIVVIDSVTVLFILVLIRNAKRAAVISLDRAFYR